MLSIEKINETILELERQDTCFAVVDKLADCYVVRDHLVAQQPKPRTGELSGSDFLRAASGVDVDALLAILDEHLQAVRAIYPGEYRAVLDRIEGLKR